MIGTFYNFGVIASSINLGGGGAYPEWSHYMDIIIDHNNFDADVQDFPVAIALKSSFFDFSNTNDDLSDLRFSKDGLPLAYEIEFNEVNTRCLVHVKLPLISASTDTVFRMHFGKVDAVCESDAPSVWSNNYVLVQHMGENQLDINSPILPTDIKTEMNVTPENDGWTRTVYTAGVLANGELYLNSSGTSAVKWERSVGAINFATGFYMELEARTLSGYSGHIFFKVGDGQKYIEIILSGLGYVKYLKSDLSYETVYAGDVLSKLKITLRVTEDQAIITAGSSSVTVALSSLPASTSVNKVEFGVENQSIKAYVDYIRYSNDPRIMVDASGSGNSGIADGTTVVDGLNGKAREFDGVDDLIRIPHSASLTVSNKLNIVSLIKPVGTQSKEWAGVILMDENEATPYSPYGIQYVGLTETITAKLATSVEGLVYEPTNGVAITSDQYSTLIGNFDGDGIDLYKNGAKAQSLIATGVTTNYKIDGYLYIGGTESQKRNFKGLIAEIRVANIDRSEAWIKAEHLCLLSSVLVMESILTPVVLPYQTSDEEFGSSQYAYAWTGDYSTYYDYTTMTSSGYNKINTIIDQGDGTRLASFDIYVKTNAVRSGSNSGWGWSIESAAIVKLQNVSMGTEIELYNATLSGGPLTFTAPIDVIHAMTVSDVSIPASWFESGNREWKFYISNQCSVVGKYTAPLHERVDVYGFVILE